MNTIQIEENLEDLVLAVAADACFVASEAMPAGGARRRGFQG